MTTRRNEWKVWRALLSCGVLLLYFLVSVLPFDELVLCVRPDGHVGLEATSGAAACLDCGREGDAQEDGCCSSSDGAGAPCRDIVVFQHEDEPGVRPLELSIPDAPLLAMLAEPRTPVPADVTHVRIERAAFHPPRALPFELALVLRV